MLKVSLSCAAARLCRTAPSKRRLKRKEPTAAEILETRALLAVFSVTDAADSGVGTLRDAVANAEATDGADEIVFDLPAGTSTIVLTSGQLEITEDLEIDGPGSDVLTIDAGGNSRIFDIEDDPDGELEVGIGGLTLTNGSADDGGAIRNQYGSVFLDDTVITNSVATDRGGAIYTLGDDRGIGLASLYLDNSRIEGNSAFDGGGIYNELDHVELFDSSIVDNTAQNNGGGAYTLAPEDDFGGEFTLLLFDSSIDSNDAGNNGGGIYNENDHVELENSSLTANTAVNQGGGVYTLSTGGFIGETFYSFDSLIADNTAGQGGAVTMKVTESKSCAVWL